MWDWGGHLYSQGFPHSLAPTESSVGRRERLEDCVRHRQCRAVFALVLCD
jgi:hypothetical protein